VTGLRERPLRVLHLRDTYRVCGPGKTIFETIRLNPDRNVEYEVAAFGPLNKNQLLQKACDLCPVLSLPESRLLLPVTALRLARRVRTKGISLLHAHDFKTDLLGLLTRAVSSVPVVTTIHGYIAITGKGKLYRAADRWLLKKMDRVIGVSEAMVPDLRKTGLPPSRIVIVRNCIALDSYPFRSHARPLRTLRGFEEGDFVVGHVGRLSREKGQQRLLTVFPAVRREIPRAKLVFAGDGPDEKPLRDLACSLGLEDCVHFAGYRGDVREIYDNLDLLVLSSDTEGLPNVVLEAMALGVPVVATAVGGTPEIVDHGVTGLLVPPSDEDALARAIIDTSTNAASAARRAAQARVVIEREFGMEALILRTHDLYRELVAEIA
jgi:glycosyltransferase involved in cell wall biosynthesis